MRGNGNISTISNGGGDIQSSFSHNKYSSEDKTGKENNEGFSDRFDMNAEKKPADNDTFNISYGNYGDPYSFFPYQLMLLLVDFVFNWTMDFVHEYPLAVLVIFVFQSLAVVINLVLYIMASASQAMHVGLQKRVNIHHYVTLCVCLIYMILTSWWFIWALRKSWPSVSDEFSFTWRSSDHNLKVNETKNGANPSLNSTSLNTTGHHHVNLKEHHTLWSPGFNALYVIQRSLGMIYYFIYLRATFLVLNTTKIDKFIEMKRELSRKLKEERNAAQKELLKKQIRRKKSSSKVKLGLDEYLTRNDILLEDEIEPIKERKRYTKKSASVLWADDENANFQNKTSFESQDFERPEQDEAKDDRIPIKQGKTKKPGKRGKKNQNLANKKDNDGVVDYEANDDDGDDKKSEVLSNNAYGNGTYEEVIPMPSFPKPRSRTSNTQQRGKNETNSKSSITRVEQRNNDHDFEDHDDY